MRERLHFSIEENHKIGIKEAESLSEIVTLEKEKKQFGLKNNLVLCWKVQLWSDLFIYRSMELYKGIKEIWIWFSLI